MSLLKYFVINSPGTFSPRGKPSPYTDNVLRVLDLTEAYFDDPRETLNKLHHFFLGEQQRASYVAFALAELSFLYAQKSAQPSYYLAAGVYAYLYLFPEEASQLPDPLDHRGRMTADLYNLSLTLGLIAKDRSTMNLQSGTYALPFGTLQSVESCWCMPKNGVKAFGGENLHDMATPCVDLIPYPNGNLLNSERNDYAQVCLGEISITYPESFPGGYPASASMGSSRWTFSF